MWLGVVGRGVGWGYAGMGWGGVSGFVQSRVGSLLDVRVRGDRGEKCYYITVGGDGVLTPLDRPRPQAAKQEKER